MTTRDDQDHHSTAVTDTVVQYSEGLITWPELVRFVKDYAWQPPDLPASDDWNGWAVPPDTFQPRTWGEVTGLLLSGLLTDDEYFALTEVYDATEPFGSV